MNKIIEGHNIQEARLELITTDILRLGVRLALLEESANWKKRYMELKENYDELLEKYDKAMGRY